MAVPCPLLSDAAAGPSRDPVRPHPAQWVKVDKPGHVLKAGDVLTLSKGSQVIAVRVLAQAEKRGPAKEAKALYAVLD